MRIASAEFVIKLFLHIECRSVLRQFVGCIEYDVKITLRSDATGSCVVSRVLFCNSAGDRISKY